MKIGFNARGMGNDEPVEIVSGLAFIGFDAVEFYVGTDSPLHPDHFEESKRKKTRSQLRTNKMIPLLQSDIDPGIEDDREAALREFRKVVELANALNHRKTPIVVSMPLRSFPTEEQVTEFADIAAENHVIIALEPVMDGGIECPEDLADIIEDIDRPEVRISFDITLFNMQGYEMEETIETCAPLSAACPVIDANVGDEAIEYVLPGEGLFDYPTYMGGLKAQGFKGVVAARVGVPLIEGEGFDAWGTAEMAFDTLSEAREFIADSW